MDYPFPTNGVLIARGASLKPKALTPGTTGQVLTGVTGAEPVFATVDLTTVVSGILPVANGGTGQTVGAVAFMPCWGVAVAAGATVFLGTGADAAGINVRWVAPRAGTVLTIFGEASVAPGVGETLTYTLNVATVDTAVTYQLTGTGAGGRVGTASGAIAVTAGTNVCVKLVTSGGAAVANHKLMIAYRVDG